MKKTFAAVTLFAVLAGSAATAQPYRHYHHHHMHCFFHHHHRICR